MTSKRRALFIVLVAFMTGLLILALYRDDVNWLLRRTAKTSTDVPFSQNSSVEVIAQNLNVPWEIVFLPGDDMLVTERPGTLKRIGKDNQTYTIEGVQHTGEGGLLGLAVHPDYASNHLIYLYLTSRDGDNLINRVERYHYDNDRLTDKKIIISSIPGASNHDGGRLAFGPDKLLYITTGDAGREELAQDTKSLAGKILRLRDDGSIPPDNPIGNAMYSYGHRNPQGLAWDAKGELWATEHGRSGVRSGLDELNKIAKGYNYGWPLIEGDETRNGMEKPTLHSGSTETWAPASLAFSNGSFYFGGLRGEALYQAKQQNDASIALTAHFHKLYGRIRAVTIGPDGQLYITTSNTDGRGEKQQGDDKILRIDPKSLQ